MELCVGQTPETISKPDPYSMDPVLERLGIPREQILYVGDTDVDMQTARNTQTAAAAAAWGYQPLEMLLPYHPEFIVRRPKQLLTIFSFSKGICCARRASSRTFSEGCTST